MSCNHNHVCTEVVVAALALKILLNLTDVVTLARIGLMTGFLLGPADDRRVSPSLLPQKQIFLMGNLCCQCTGCAWRRHLGLQSNVDNIQGVLGEGTLGYKVMLMIYRVCVEKAPGLQSKSDDIQGVLGEGSLVS